MRSFILTAAFTLGATLAHAQSPGERPCADLEASVLRANEILHFLEKDHRKNKQTKKIADAPREQFQMNLFEADPKMSQVRALLNNLDINTLSPVEALLKLNEIISLLKK